LKHDYAQTPDLLAYLADELNCEYISDLRHVSRSHNAILPLLKKIPAELFPLEQWKTAADYLLNRIPDGDTVEELYDALIKGLEG